MKPIHKTAKTILLMIIVLFISGALFGLELKEGRMKLVLHENLGKFSLYYLSDIGKNKYTPLFLDEDPRTTSLSIIQGNSVYRTGESSSFKQVIESTSGGAKFIWRSSSLQISEEFSFINSASSPLADGIKITITITNLSEVNHSVGGRYIFDTYLGEDPGTHFTTDDVARITGETAYMKYNLPAYINSPSEDASVPGFQLMLQGGGITSADKVVLANWKRLNDATWDYEVRSSRNFNALPYSINDSGIAVYFEPKTLSPGSEREITMALGAYNERGFAAASASSTSDIAEVFNQTMNSGTGDGQDTTLSVQTDLLTINDLLKKINKKFESGETVTESELDLMNQVINELKKRMNKYSSE